MQKKKKKKKKHPSFWDHKSYFFLKQRKRLWFSDGFIQSGTWIVLAGLISSFETHDFNPQPNAVVLHCEKPPHSTAPQLNMPDCNRYADLSTTSRTWVIKGRDRCQTRAFSTLSWRGSLSLSRQSGWSLVLGLQGKPKKQQVQRERGLEASGPALLCPPAFSLATSRGSICSHRAKDRLSWFKIHPKVPTSRFKWLVELVSLLGGTWTKKQRGKP